MTNASIIRMRMLWILVLLVSFGCGALEYKTVNYDTDTQAPNTPNPEPDSELSNCEIGLLGYNTYIKPFAESACLSCHVEGGIAASYFQLVAGDSEENLIVFAGLLDGTAASVVAKASGQTTHAGGAALSSDRFDDVENFYKMLTLCESSR